MRIEDLTINENATVLQALKQLDTTGYKVLFVTEQKCLKAVFTDGDVRRHLLAGGKVEDHISVMANYHPIQLSQREAHLARRVMKEHQINALPIVDEQHKIIDIEFASGYDIPVTPKINLPVVMMAGGLGTRLYPYTKILPKPLIPIGEQPIAEHIIDRFYDAGCQNFFMVVNYKKGMIKSYFSELEKPYQVYYIDEEKPLGTGGGLSLLGNKLKETFFFTNCDILVDVDFSNLHRFHKENGHHITMVCALKDYTIPYGVIEHENGFLTQMKEKPHLSFYINTGLYIVEPDVINFIEPNHAISFPEVIERVKQAGYSVGVYPVSEQSWMDMGQLEELDEMRRKLEERS